jgi:SAM-dependent methyltransferase
VIAKSDFDAALVPGFREATRREYAALDAAWDETSSAVLDGEGAFLPGTALNRDCPLCSAASSAAELRFTKLGMEIVTCRACGMTYSRQVLRADLDRQLYLRSAAQSGLHRLKRNEAYAKLERTKCRYIVQRIGAFRQPPGRLLDVGPGAGRLLEAAVAAGWQVLGVEADPELAAACRTAGFPVVEGFFPDCVPPGERFDAIALLDVLEHSGQPAAFLKAVAERLAPEGVLAIQVPNLNSLLVQVEGATNTNFCHGHWNHFEAGTLERIARIAGLEPLEVETIISELDRILRHPRAEVTRVATALAGAPRDGAIDAEWLHRRRLGYKLLGLFRRQEAHDG